LKRLPIRGGNWNNGAISGVFALNLNNARSNANTNIGARPALGDRQKSQAHAASIFFRATRPPTGARRMSDQTTSHAIEATLAATGSKATYTGAGMTVGGWMLSSEFAVLFGMLIGLAGLGVQWYYRHKLTMAEIRLKEEQAAREREAHAARMGMYQ
jgi:hypothetical protein